MAYFLRKTFIEGKKQTKTSLAINQFNIFHDELKGLVVEAKEMRFHTDLGNGILKTLNHEFEKANGIYYIGIFSISSDLKLTLAQDAEDNRALINDFRHNVLFPLSQYYDKLYHFLNRIKCDETLSLDYKKILYNYIERDILQTYLRVCNYERGNKRHCELSIFKTEVYDQNSFYNINNFYIDNSAFQYKDQAFYIKTF